MTPFNNGHSQLGYISELTMALYDYATMKTQLDHPLCTDCTANIRRNIIKKQFNELEFEKQRYESFLKELESTQHEKEGSKSYETEIKELEQEEKHLRSELHQTVCELRQVETEYQDLTKEIQHLNQKEQQYWQDYNSTLIEFEASKENRHALKRRKRAYIVDVPSAYLDAFHFSYRGKIGTINKFALGKSPEQPFHWSETNAAWGHVALLLAALARMRNFQFELYNIIPRGSSSLVEKISTKQRYQLYGGGGTLYWQSDFNSAMVGFLTCLKELSIKAKSQDSSIALPYSIEGDKIGDESIKYHVHNEERWTKALKNMLTNLKYLYKSQYKRDKGQ